MKNKLVLFVLLAGTLAAGCTKKCQGTDAVVVRDCSGTYLRINEKDYQVCNVEMVAAFDHGATIKAVYRPAAECNADLPVCMLLHSSEGFINVQEAR